MAGGRPTSYKEEYIEEVDKFTDECLRDPEKPQLPTIEGFAGRIGVDVDTITLWGKQFPEFFGAIKRLKEKQKNQLQNHGMYGKVNTAMAIFLLKVNHGMIETNRTEIGATDELLKSIRGQQTDYCDNEKPEL